MMELRRVVIALHEMKRVILYPEGGLEIERFENGPGWVIDSTIEPGEDECLEALLLRVQGIVSNAYAHFVD